MPRRSATTHIEFCMVIIQVKSEFMVSIDSRASLLGHMQILCVVMMEQNIHELQKNLFEGTGPFRFTTKCSLIHHLSSGEGKKKKIELNCGE